MSIQVVTGLTGMGVPRFSEATVEALEDESNFLTEKDFFCSCGYSFSVAFSSAFEGVVLPIWECPECETVALDFPPGVRDKI